MQLKNIKRLGRPLLLAAFLTLAAVASAGLASRTEPMVRWLDVGSPGDEAYANLFFPPESNSDETFRWTAEYAELTVPIERAGRYRLAISLATIRPEGRTLTITCEGGQYPVELTSLGADSTVTLDCETADGELSLAFEVPVVRLPDGGRPLGVSIRDVQVTALDGDDQRAFRFMAWVTIFSSIAGTALTGWVVSRRSATVALASGGVLLPGWAALIQRYPDAVLAAVSGPGGLLALIAAMTAVLLHSHRRLAAAALAFVAVISGFVWQQPDGVLVLESRWVMEELAALTIMPWLALLAVVASVSFNQQRAYWLAAAGTGIAVISLALPALAARFVETRVVDVNGPDWSGHGGIAGGIYVLLVFGLVGLAIAVGRLPDKPPALNIGIIAAIGITGLLLWRIQIMRFNGDEPHYYVTAWSLGEDRDLELLNNYVSDRYQTLTYSPVGNIALERDASVFRYAAAAPGPEQSWLLIPPLPDGWTASDGREGLLEAARQAVVLRGPEGAVTIPPPLRPALHHAVMLEEPCRVSALAAGILAAGAPADITVTILNRDGKTLWQTEAIVTDSVEQIEIPADSGLCQGSGNWTIRVDASQEIVVEAIDRYNGMQLIGGNLNRGWNFGGLPRDRYGSTDVSARLLLHNPTDGVLQATVRLVTNSDRTTSEITIGLNPGETVVEPLPVFGATSILVRVTEEAEVAAGLYGIVDGARYRIPAVGKIGSYSVQLPADVAHDAGGWLTLFNPSQGPAAAVIEGGDGNEQVDICGLCAEVRLVPAGDTSQLVRVDGNVGVTAVVYEERTGQLHYDIGLPLIAAPLTLFDESWLVLLVTAAAGVLLGPGLYHLVQIPRPQSERTFAFVAMVMILAPVSTYAVRFYTDLVAATLLIWGLVLWERGWKSNRALAAAALIAVALPVLHGRLIVLAAGLLALVLFAGVQTQKGRLRAIDRRWMVPAAIAVVGLTLLGVGIILSQFAVALGNRGIGTFFRLTWVLPNTFGMLLDRGSGVLPFAPWLAFALAVPRPLHRTHRAALILVILYYALLALRAGGWQTWGSPIRYLLPIVPLVAALAIPGMVRFWGSGNVWKRVVVAGVLGWSVAVSVLLHWLPLAGYIDRTTPGNDYLIDQALDWLPFPSPFARMPTIEALPGPTWGEPIGIVILAAFAAAAAWTGLSLVRDQELEVRD